MLNFSNKSEFNLILFVSLSVILVFITLSIAAFPAADDYCYAIKVGKLGFVGSQLDWYFNWSGRFSATALMSLISMAGDIGDTYSQVLIVAQLVTVAAVFLFLRSLFQQQFPLRYVLLTSLTFYVIFLTGLPDTAQYIYWTMGIADYALGNVALLLLLAIAAQCELGGMTNRVLSILLFVTAAILSIIAVGTNELTMFCVMALLLGATALAIKHHTESVWFWIGLFIIAVLGALVSIFAPGNLARAQSLATDGMLRPPGVLAAVLFFPWFLLRAAYWLANPAIWVSALIVLILSRESAINVLYRDKVFQRRWLYVPVFWATLLLALTGLGFAIDHYPLPERAESTVWLVFLLGWYPSFIIIFHYTVGDHAANFFEPFKRLAVVFLAISILGSPNVVEAFKDTYRGLRYWREMSARMNLIREAKNKGLTDIEVPSLSRPPRTLFTTEITTDPNNFRNTCLAEYRGLKSISLGRNQR
jgi:hypothetical protein